MSDAVIRVEGLGKKYVIGHQESREGYQALRDVMMRNVRRLGRSMADLARGRPNVAGDTVEEFWALKGVSFEVNRGDVVGVIGRNGAGKSTLLKVLSRITEPSEGRVHISGRVASLLEVGTGFHPELTGRENIYLNGAILGMTRAEIHRKFDEIVAFAEVEKFLDTPVKRYSSGMYVRLAFAVAAHLEPEILIVDEVLAVGDAQFQQKCLGKMQDVAGHGRTVLFVSHNMAAVKRLCRTGILLQGGQLAYAGPAEDVIQKHLLLGSEAGGHFVRTSPPEADKKWIKDIQILQRGERRSHVELDAPISIRVQLNMPCPPSISLLLSLSRADGVCLHHICSDFSESDGPSSIRTATFPPHAFGKGTILLDAALLKHNVELFDHVIGACRFEVIASGGSFALSARDWRGLTGPGLANWSFEPSGLDPAASIEEGAQLDRVEAGTRV